MQSIVNYIKYPNRFFLGIVKKTSFLYTDSFYLRLYYLCEMGKRLNINNPKTFTEKIQWLKLYNHRPEYTNMVDKFAVKSMVAKKIGDEFVIPLLGWWNRPEEIDWEALPDSFVLKTTHGGGSGGVFICKNKANVNKQEVLERLSRCLKQNIYDEFREWPYKDVPPRIIAEKYIEDENGELKDYKFFCFNGHVKCFKIDYDRFTRHRANYYSDKGEILPFGEKACPPDFEKRLVLPKELDKMISLAEKLSEGIPFLRVDFYLVKNKVLFGEMTFFPASGMGRFEPDEWDETLGGWLNLKEVKKKSL